MQESFWAKHLSNGGTEQGTDEAIEKKLASWTRGRQNIISTLLSFAGSTICLQCSPKNQRLAAWKQIDNFVFNPSTGKSERLSREVWCSPNGYQFWDVRRCHDGTMFYSFNDEAGTPVPDYAQFLVCFISADGRVSSRWS